MPATRRHDDRCDQSRTAVVRRTRRKTIRRAALVLTTSLFAAALAAACSQKSVHRVLVFFYDGVPPLETELGEPDADIEELIQSENVVPAAAEPAEPTIYLHPAYKESRCEACHVSEGGGLLKTAREGLCLSCHEHRENPPKKEYTHAPVATRDCLACHTYHKSRYPKLLLADAQTVCFYCHQTENLITDKHHETIDKERCVDCHDAHGGDDPFYLLPKAKAQQPS